MQKPIPIIGLFLTACTTVTPVINPTNTTEVIPSVVIVNPTNLPTITPTLQAKIPKSVSVVDGCIPLEEGMPDSLDLSGVWVRNQVIPYLENLDEQVTYLIPFEGGGYLSRDFSISPDGKYLAYIDPYLENTRTNKRILRIIKSSGHSLDMRFWVEDWQWIIGWVDDKHLALFTGNKEVIKLNPFSGQWERIEQPSWLNYPKWYSTPLYNPTLDWVLHIPKYNVFELKDVHTGEYIWGTARGDRSNWSADGTVFVNITVDTLTVVEPGKHKIDNYDIRSLGFEDTYLGPVVLSPEAKRVYFVGRDDARDNVPYFIEIAKEKAFQVCISSDTNFSRWGIVPFWSPDGRFVIQSGYTSSYDDFDVLIDTHELRAYKLVSGELQHRILWLASPY